MKYNIGDIVRITARLNGHDFLIGDEVKLTSQITGNCYMAYLVRNPNFGFSVLTAEIELVAPAYVPCAYEKGSSQPEEYGKYLVVRKDGKIHFEVWNGTGWAYNAGIIQTFYLPKISQ